jgi:hypothetical protein
VDEVDRGNMHIAAIVRDCPPVSFEGDSLILKARSHFHKEKLESERARAFVEDAISKLLGRPCQVKCTLTPEKSNDTPRDRDLQRLADDPVIKAGLELGGEIGTIK